MDFTRVFDILEYQLAKFPRKDALANKVNGVWTAYSTESYYSMVNKLSVGLLQLNIRKNDKIAIISTNRPEWNFIDLAIQQIGAISVPIYPTITKEDYKFIFEDAEIRMAFVSNEELFEKVCFASKDLKNYNGTYSFDNVEQIPNWQNLIDDISQNELESLKLHKKTVLPEDVFTIIYTSGTTGVPKGVMLTHNNLVTQVKGATLLMPVDHTCTAFSFLPLCHIYERMLSYVYQSIGLGIYYAENLESIGDNLKEVHPHIFVTVPRLLEKVYDKIVAKGQTLTGLKKWLFFWALDLGKKYELNNSQGIWYDLQLKIANKIIFNKWREALGGNIKVIVSGGAALQPRLAKVFSAAQVVILEGYGLTETSPVIAVNHFDEKERCIGTVGPVFPSVEVKIADDGEILSRGPHIMKGYYNRPDLTKDVIDEQGWFHTGDVGEITAQGFLKITDRKKEIFKTSGGKYIAPGSMENKFKESKYIEQIMVVGESRKFPSALIVPSFDMLKAWCNQKGIDYNNNKAIICHKEVIKLIQNEVDKLNENYAQFEKIKKYVLLPAEWTIENGELTPTLKLKRRNILSKYEKSIASIYDHDFE
jgi:long-chain acyl-CoA synthetase